MSSGLSPSFEPNFKKLTERGHLNQILQTVLQAMNAELEDMMTQYCLAQKMNKNPMFVFDELVQFKEDLSSACGLICGDIL